MDTQTSHRATLSLAVLAAFTGIYLIWGTTYVAIALAIRTVPPFIAGGARFLLAGAIVYAWLLMRGQRNPLAGIDLRLAALCGVLLPGIGNGFVAWAQQGIPSGVGALVVAAVPVIVLVLDWAFFSKRTPSRLALVGTSIAVAGVVTIVMHTRTLSGDARPVYLFAAVVATLAWSMGTLVQKRGVLPGTVLSFTCAQMLAGGVFQLAMSVLDSEWQRFDVSSVTASSVIAVLYLAVFGSIVALNCYLWLLTRVAAPKVTTYALVNPVVALMLGALVLDERLTFTTLTAVLLVLAGVSLVLFQNFSPARAWRFVFPGRSRTARSQR